MILPAAGFLFGIGVGGQAAIGAAVTVLFAAVGTRMFFGCGLFGLFAVARFAFLAGNVVGFFGLKVLMSLGPLGLFFLGFPLEKVELGMLLLVLRLAVRALGFGSILLLPAFFLIQENLAGAGVMGRIRAMLFTAECGSLSGFTGGDFRLLPGLLRAMIFIFRGVIVGVVTFLVASLQGFLSVCMFADPYKFCSCGRLWAKTIIRHQFLMSPWSFGSENVHHVRDIDLLEVFESSR
jgi:hypothetical protein